MAITVYALTDSHQECRNLCTLLSGIKEDYISGKPFIVLDCGDLFKGIYKRDLSVDSYISFKEQFPQAQIFITIGNNDFGFDEDSFLFYKSALKDMSDAGINFVCANLKDIKTGEYSDIVPRYKIVKIENRRVLITGFCLNTSVVKRFGYEFEDAKKSLLNLQDIVKEEYDNMIILNHHWYPNSKQLKDFAAEHGIKIDLIIGGHEHSPIKPDFKNNIYYPLAFARTLYKMNIDSKISDVKEYSLDRFTISKEYDNFLSAYEDKVELYKPFAKRVLNLYKWYSEPCALGTFISDNMKRVAQTDIAFHSTGFTMYPLKTEDSDVITNYDFEKVICAPTPIVKMNLSVSKLKEVFSNATMNRMYKNSGNARFVQCSGNIKLIGKGNMEDKTYKIIQIIVNGEELLDENGNPKDSEKQYSCAIDDFISKGEQGFSVLKNVPRAVVKDKNGSPVQINKLLKESLLLAEKEYKSKSEYQSFELIDL